MNEQRLIVKYPNRRLYDTTESRYITLVDLRQLVLDDIDFVVKTKSTDIDITRNVLLDIISEEEQQRIPILKIDSLRSVIRRQILQHDARASVSLNNHNHSQNEPAGGKDPGAPH